MFLLNVYSTIYTSNNGCDVCSTVSRCHNVTSTLAPYVQRRGLRQVRSSSSSGQSGLRISFQDLILLHFDQIISLKSLSINLFLLARLNLGLQLMRLRVQASQKALCSEKEIQREREREKKREREKEGCLNSVRTYLRGTVLQGCSC